MINETTACRFVGMLQIKQGDLTRGIATLQEALILAQQLDSKYELYAILWDIAQGTQQAIGESAFVEAVEQGRAMSVEEAIKYGLEVSTNL